MMVKIAAAAAVLASAVAYTQAEPATVIDQWGKDTPGGVKVLAASRAEIARAEAGN